MGGAQEADMKAFARLWLLGDWRGINHVVADKGYDFSAVRVPIREAGKKPVIPRRKNAFIPGVQDTERYKTRSAIERFFARLKENKRLVARFEKLDSSLLAFIALACLKILNLLC